VADDDQVLRRWSQVLRGVGSDLAAATAGEVSAAVYARTEAALKAGGSPAGDSWPDTQAGTRPLQHAAGALQERTSGRYAGVVVTGHHALHQLDANGNAPQYQQLPEGLTPDDVEAVRTALSARLAGDLGR
jgi:hypothetical protein